MLTIRSCLAATLLVVTAGAARADAVTELLRTYEVAGAGAFNAREGESFWTRTSVDPKTGETRRCSACHGEDLRRPGKHATTGKAIDPLAPSANPKRLTDIEKVEKWFLRNCRWTLGRECTPQEKGNVLVMLRDK